MVRGLLVNSLLPLFVKGGSCQCESRGGWLWPASPWRRGADLCYQVGVSAREVPLCFAVELRHSAGRVGAACSVWQVLPNHTLKLTSLSAGQLAITSPLLWSQQEVVSSRCASPCSRRPPLQKAAASLVDGAGWRKVSGSLKSKHACHQSTLITLLCRFLSLCLPEGRPSPVLKEVQLDLVNPAKCRHVLQTVKASVFNQGPSRSHITVLCAGPERGGKDACQVEKLSIYPSIHRSAIHPFINLSIHLPFCREILGAHWCAQQGPVEATWWHLVLRPGVKDVVGVGVTTAVAIPPKEDPRVCSQMSSSCCLGSSKDWERVSPD